MGNVRDPAVAGFFYPAERETLASDISGYLSAAPIPATVSPKALITPHAGYVYSGQVAANAYAAWRPEAESIKRIVLIGPAHRVAFQGIAAPTVEAFKTPLGDVPIDTDAVDTIRDMPQVLLDDEPHRQEHSLEVHIPFLQSVLGEFKLLPLVAGSVSGEQVAEVLERLWGDDSTRFVISTDLSHYQDYETAQKLDGATAEAIEGMNPAAIGQDQACGRIPVAGMLLAARNHGLSVDRIDLCNSGDTAGKKDKVVGYGSWAVCSDDAGAPATPTEDDRAMLQREGARIFRAAAQSVGYAIKNGKPPKVDLSSFPTVLQENRATFITINKNGQLRGCIGTIQAHQPLIADVVENAYKAAMKDPRFPPIQEDETAQLELSISLLSRFTEMSFSNEADFLGQLRPKIDGLIITDQGKRSVFLPQVWESIPETTEFVARLKQKAGLPTDHWSDNFQAWRFTAISVKAAPKPQ
jgi:MEMO1 family protein